MIKITFIMITMFLTYFLLIIIICISYVTSMRYVSRINHEARVIYSGNVPNRGHDISNLCLHESVVMVNGAKFLVLSP